MKYLRWLPHPFSSLALWIIWLMFNNTIAPAHVLLGAILGIAIPWITRALWPERPHLSHPLTALRLFFVVMYDIVIANLIVARLILGPVSALRPAFVELPLQLRSPYAISALASIITLTPGTVSVSLSEDRRTLLVHALDVDDRDALIAEIKQRYEMPLKEIFEC
ncbi:MAG: Na+/H+ antiporter subunit E [Burkholderiales bacterium RIFCSPLOWO2_02_FULL_57_36]|nr:MAG: Na+/H+ antiporter subunit E [Burkholderiales bacterium RIFCSPLOWO2_02_FULL_57_36]